MSLPQDDEEITVTRSGFLVDGQQTAVDAPPPRLGQHTNEILRGLGLTDATIAGLQEEGAI
jgi:formyl-CoA transferase